LRRNGRKILIETFDVGCGFSTRAAEFSQRDHFPFDESANEQRCPQGCVAASLRVISRIAWHVLAFAEFIDR
jgi:hypothetical protein